MALENNLTPQMGGQPEGVQVAGALGAAFKAGSKARINRSPLNPDSAVQTYKGATMIREATPSEMAVFEAAPVRLDGKPGATGVRYFELNLDQLASAFGDDLAGFQSKIVEMNKKAIEEAKRGKMSIKEIGVEAERLGLSQMLTKLASRKKGQALGSAEELYQALVVQKATLHMANHAYKKMIKEGTEESAAEFLGAMSLQGAVTSSLIGAKAETGRMMAVLRNFNMVVDAQVSPDMEDVMGIIGRSKDDVPDMSLTPREIVERAGGIERVQHMGVQYMALTNAQKTNLNRNGWRWLGKGYDIFVESFLMSILSGPTTHMVNISSNLANLILEIPVNFGAAAMGKLRGTEDAMTFTEAAADLVSMIQAVPDALNAAVRAFKTEETSDFVSKIDFKRQAISAENLEIDPTSKFGKVMDAWGRIIRIPGRFLLATDEGFKAVAMRQALYREAISAGMTVRRAGKLTGESDEAFKARVEKKIADTIENPPTVVREAAQDYARYKTFQTPITGKNMTALQNFTNVPPFKFLMPFFQTPTNVISQVFEYTPFAPATKHFRESFSKGGKHADVAMSRMMGGSGLMAYFIAQSSGMFGDEKLMTGYGPRDPKARQTWLDQGFKPYSFAFKQANGRYKSISYSRFDPISGLLAIAADTGWHLRHEGADAGPVVAAALGAAYTYLNELPMMEGFNEISKMFRGGPNEDPTSVLERATKMFGRAMIKAVPGFLPVSPTGSFADTVQRYMDPAKRNTAFPEEARKFLSYKGDGTLDGVVRNFYEVLQQGRSMTPFYSKDLPPRLNRWGIEQKESNGQVYEMFSPIKVGESIQSGVLDELRSLQYGFANKERSISGIDLSAEQQNRYIQLANETASETTKLNLLGQLNDEISKYKAREAKGEFVTRGEKITALKRVDDGYWTAASKQMRLEFPDLDAAIREAEMSRKAFGPKVQN